jgi:hypothetical protein
MQEHTSALAVDVTGYYTSTMKYLIMFCFLVALWFSAPTTSAQMVGCEGMTIRQAQALLDSPTYDRYRDPNRLDPDRDGRACEQNAYDHLPNGSVLDDHPGPSSSGNTNLFDLVPTPNPTIVPLGGGYNPPGGVMPTASPVSSPTVTISNAPPTEGELEQHKVAQRDAYTKRVLILVGIALAVIVGYRVVVEYRKETDKT